MGGRTERGWRSASGVVLTGALVLAGVVVAGAYAQPGGSGPDYVEATGRWIPPGASLTLAQDLAFDDATGKEGLYNAAGPIETAGNPFFQPLGPNGRACVTCHQPADGMSLSLATIRARWDATGGKDPMFAAIDGSDCPSLPQDRESSHSLLLKRGLFRIALPWPPRGAGARRSHPSSPSRSSRTPPGATPIRSMA